MNDAQKAEFARNQAPRPLRIFAAICRAVLRGGKMPTCPNCDKRALVGSSLEVQAWMGQMRATHGAICDDCGWKCVFNESKLLRVVR